MIEIKFPEPCGSNLHICIAGHSGSGPKGHDLVCSAVSSLVLTMLGGLETVLKAKISGSFQEGFCNVQIKVGDEDSTHFEAVSKIFRYGFLRMATAYPHLVRISCEERGESHGS